MAICTLCPRKCGVDRGNARGVCGGGEKIRLARADLHFWEEPCLVGKGGSGAVFFSGCTLRCSYCQNYAISSGNEGFDIDDERFSEILYELKDKGAENINLVTADHYLDAIVPILRREKALLSLPIVYNCSGYESPEMLALLDGIVDIYLVDYKYADNALGEKLSHVPDYADVAKAALIEMYRQVGKAVLDENGMMQKGILLRHLVLPGYRKNSFSVLDSIAALLPVSEIILSLMSQFTPNGIATDPARRLTRFEYESVTEKALSLGFTGYFQEFSSQKSEYTPDFNGQGVTKSLTFSDNT